MSRAAVFTLLTTDSRITDVVEADDVFATQSVDSPDDRPFIIIRWEDVTPAFGRRGKQRVSMWIHDYGNDYTRINDLIESVKDVLLEALHVEGADGWTLTQVDWMGDSPDLVDHDYGTVMRSTSFDVVARYTTT